VVGGVVDVEWVRGEAGSAGCLSVNALIGCARPPGPPGRDRQL